MMTSAGHKHRRYTPTTLSVLSACNVISSNAISGWVDKGVHPTPAVVGSLTGSPIRFIY